MCRAPAIISREKRGWRRNPDRRRATPSRDAPVDWTKAAASPPRACSANVPHSLLALYSHSKCQARCGPAQAQRTLSRQLVVNRWTGNEVLINRPQTCRRRARGAVAHHMRNRRSPPRTSRQNVGGRPSLGRRRAHSPRSNIEFPGEICHGLVRTQARKAIAFTDRSFPADGVIAAFRAKTKHYEVYRGSEVMAPLGDVSTFDVDEESTPFDRRIPTLAGT